MSLASKLPWTHRFAGGYPGLSSQPLPTDADAIDYLTRVAAADGAGVETGVATAVDAFFRDSKAAGVFSALKACCILAGARTLAGALVPVVGDAPTNVANGFVSGDYSRTAGLGDPGAASYLDTGRANNADPQNDNHLAVYETQPQSGVYTNRYLAGRQESSSPSFTLVGTGYFNKSASGAALGEPISIGLHAVSRSSSSEFQYVRASGAPQTVEVASSAVTSVNNMLVFTFTGNQFTDARIGFYSIGTSLSLEDLDTAVSNLLTRMKFALLTGENPAPYDIDTVTYVVRGYENGSTLQ